MSHGASCSCILQLSRHGAHWTLVLEKTTRALTGPISPNCRRPLNTALAYGSNTTRACRAEWSSRMRRMYCADCRHGAASDADAGCTTAAACGWLLTYASSLCAASRLTHRVVPLALALLMHLLVGAKHAVAVEQRGVKTRQRHVPHIARLVVLCRQWRTLGRVGDTMARIVARVAQLSRMQISGATRSR